MSNLRSAAVATQERSAVTLIPTYQAEFGEVLPAHIDADRFVKLAQAALRKNADLRKAAENDPASLIFALREAARLGHDPGTDSFWLIPLGGKVEGWEGYKGVVERMYRAGAVLSVKCDVVRENDEYDYDVTMNRPWHKKDRRKPRGDIYLAYAFAEMRDGAISKVAEADQEYIDKLRQMSRGSSGANSPWNKWDESMWLKGAINRLEPWVPTSSEYLREQLRAVRDVAREPAPVPLTAAPQQAQPNVDTDTGVIDGAIVEDPPGWEPVAEVKP